MIVLLYQKREALPQLERITLLQEKMTIEDIAIKAGVGIAKVSRVMNNSWYVSEKTRMKVEAVIRNSGYVPSVAARNFAKQDSNMVGVIVPEAHNPYFGSAIEGISGVLDKSELLLVLFSSNKEFEKEEKILYQVKQQNLKGLIITPAIDNMKHEEVKRYMELISSMNIPVVFMDSGFELSDWDMVCVDNSASAYTIICKMIDQGNDEIGIITGNLKTKTARDRYEGYVKALQAYGLSVKSEFVYHGDFTTDTAYQITKNMLQKGKYPRTVFTTNNLTTIGFIKAVYDSGLKLGEDIDCVSFDKINSFEELNYNYIERDPRKMGTLAAEMLLNRTLNPELPTRKYYMPYKVRIFQK